ncbi:MAG: hypothetical protein KDK40_03410 [Chlamydiia bacterium]|nr:hypothetical protein [Chlamydiia bacterium]
MVSNVTPRPPEPTPLNQQRHVERNIFSLIASKISELFKLIARFVEQLNDQFDPIPESHELEKLTPQITYQQPTAPATGIESQALPPMSPFDIPQKVIAQTIQTIKQQWDMRARLMAGKADRLEETKGITNIGNSCYINSVLTIILNTCMRDDTGESMHPTQPFDPSSTPSVIDAMRMHYPPKNEEDAIRLQYHVFCLREQFIAENQLPNITAQQDVAEFLQFLLDKLEINFSVCETNPNGNQVITPQTCASVHLPKLQSGEEFKDAFQRVVGENIQLVDSPKVLPIQLKRFDYSTEINRSIKLNHLANVPESLQVPALDGAQKYTLNGYIIHLGEEVGSGHYVAVVKKGDDWFLYNDEKVTKLSAEEESCLRSQSYLCFFQKG